MYTGLAVGDSFDFGSKGRGFESSRARHALLTKGNQFYYSAFAAFPAFKKHLVIRFNIPLPFY